MCSKKQLQEQRTPILLNNYSLHFREEEKIKRFRKDRVFRKDCVSSKPCMKPTLHCNHRSGHLKTEHTESLFLLRRHLGNWPRSKQEKRTAGSARETWTVAAADGVRCARVR